MNVHLLYDPRYSILRYLPKSYNVHKKTFSRMFIAAFLLISNGKRSGPISREIDEQTGIFIQWKTTQS